VFGLDEATTRLRDARTRRHIPTLRIVRSLFLMMWVRIGSLNGLEQARSGGFWSRWLGGKVPSADALGDAAALLSLDDLRGEAHRQYLVLKRNKAIQPLPGGFLVVVLDGHESGASYLRSSPGSLQRTITTAKGERVQFYYRHVAALLLHGGGQLLLDIEAQLPGEGEIAAALRLFERVAARYSRAFNVVAGDALYLNPDFCRRVRSKGKDFVIVLKNENRDLITDARGLLPLVEPILWEEKDVKRQCWDIGDLTTWTQFGSPVRVVRSLETRSVRRQRTDEVVTETAEWLWATSIRQDRASTKTVVRIGHGRWTIENQASTNSSTNGTRITSIKTTQTPSPPSGCSSSWRTTSSTLCSLETSSPRSAGPTPPASWPKNSRPASTPRCPCTLRLARHKPGSRSADSLHLDSSTRRTPGARCRPDSPIASFDCRAAASLRPTPPQNVTANLIPIPAPGQIPISQPSTTPRAESLGHRHFCVEFGELTCNMYVG